ncbi:hypothetical protein [Curtobacterium sp. MCPF17_052]|uniref:hypothetical protein n=1 Tax=Curtobacterium sp. MCPF17_052 TaxID=2175655 RepID=UPI0024DF6A13|nr:hypothetical protein [Curtobacterium sp. MCPF17_052]WIB11991.1 hypothetical protein DEJ36_14275 [Curtobacterium sp. MCPF17_052]
MPTIQSASSWRTLAVAAGVAAVFLLLVAGPVRVLAGALRERVPLRAARFTGRNRTRSERRHGDDAVASWVTITLGIAVAGVLTLLGTGIALEARYVRLAIGVVAGVAVLSAGVVLATRWTAGEDRHTVTFRLSPRPAPRRGPGERADTRRRPLPPPSSSGSSSSRSPAPTWVPPPCTSDGASPRVRGVRPGARWHCSSSRSSDGCCTASPRPPGSPGRSSPSSPAHSASVGSVRSS